MTHGSSWKIWDLHVHTPLSIRQGFGGDSNESWEKYISDLEALPATIKVIGINDYLFLDGYRKVLEFRKRGRLSNLDLILPVIELRVDKFGNLSEEDPWSRVNVHVIFSDQINPEVIQTQFIGAMQSSLKLSNDVKGYWSGTIPSQEYLEDFGRVILENSPKKSSDSNLVVGFNNLTYDFDKVLGVLSGSHFFDGSYLIAVGKSEWESLRWDQSAADKKHVINSAQFVFSASENVDACNNAIQKLKEQGVNDLLLDCSDAHNYSDSVEKDRIGHCYTWIKADSTFDGLKQILYERSRLRISDSEHVPPAKRIRSVTLTFPDATKIYRSENRRDEDKHSPFCLNGERVVFFSPYFTCLIGGRGSGKSTLLNLIASKSGLDSEFFKNNLVSDPTGNLDVNEFVEIDGSTDIEFISQNEIESFAESGELTDAIYSRLKGLHGIEVFDDIETQLHISLVLLDSQMRRIREAQTLDESIRELDANFSEANAIVSSFSSEEYGLLIKQIEIKSNEREILIASKSRYDDLVTELEVFVSRFQSIDEPNNPYDSAYNGLVLQLQKSIETPIDFSASDAEINRLNDELTAARTKLREYLVSKGVSEQNQEDFDRASSSLPIIRVQLSELNENKARLQNEIDSFSLGSQVELVSKNQFDSALGAAFIPLNEKLHTITSNGNVKEIRFEYQFDSEAAREGIFRDFSEEFETLKNQELRTQITSIKDNLFSTTPANVTDYEEYLVTLEESREDSNSKKFVQDVFADVRNFDIYKLIIRRHFGDSYSYKKIVGFYGDRELKSCSFGQRCTAVMVALIMFGNKPLVIDEPEAHLDSRLIAEYLVNLIKERKLERQLIFATHNANFVINGDAELIHILEVEDNHLTTISSTTIENIETRDNLLSLEGGKDAFERRDRRLIRT